MKDWIYGFSWGFIVGCVLFISIIAVKAVADNMRFDIYADHHCVQQIQFSRDARGEIVQTEVVTCVK